jgi:hypothetical protein
MLTKTRERSSDDDDQSIVWWWLMHPSKFNPCSVNLLLAGSINLCRRGRDINSLVGWMTQVRLIDLEKHQHSTVSLLINPLLSGSHHNFIPPKILTVKVKRLLVLCTSNFF